MPKFKKKGWSACKYPSTVPGLVYLNSSDAGRIFMNVTHERSGSLLWEGEIGEPRQGQWGSGEAPATIKERASKTANEIFADGNWDVEIADMDLDSASRLHRVFDGAIYNSIIDHDWRKKH